MPGRGIEGEGSEPETEEAMETADNNNDESKRKLLEESANGLKEDIAEA